MAEEAACFRCGARGVPLIHIEDGIHYICRDCSDED